MKRWLLLAAVAAVVAVACSSMKKTVKDTQKDLHMRDDVIGQPVDGGAD
jgi:uncharacterized protein YcfL